MPEPTWELVETEMPDLLPMQGRSEGYHLSDIIKSICIERKIYDPSTSPCMAQMQLGCALEDAVIRRLVAQSPDRYIVPGEICKDGVYMTPDCFDLERPAVIECKLPFISARHDIMSDKLWRYRAQVMGYCHGLEVATGELHCAFVRGDYTDNVPVAWRVWRKEFSGRTLRENWSFLMKHLEKMKKTKRSENA